MSKSEKKFTLHRKPLHFLGTLHDIVCVFLCAVIFNYVCLQQWQMDEKHIVSTVIVSLVVVFININANFIVVFRASLFLDIIWRFFLFWLIAFGAVDTASSFLLSDTSYDSIWLAFTLLSSYILLISNRLILTSLIWFTRKKRKYSRGVFLIGSSESVISLGRRIKNYSSEGFSIAGIQRLSTTSNKEIIDNIVTRVRRSNAVEVWISLPLDMGQFLKELLYQLRNETAEVRFFPVFDDEMLLNHRVSELVGGYSIDLSVTPISGQAQMLKRFEDVALSIAISFVIVPICLFIALAIKLTSPGPVLFTQYRTGVSGNHFKVYKFRTMSVHSEEEGIVQAVKNDTRVTKLGAFLRKTSLDEFPQIINVFQGNMSLVGPRPHALSHNEYYKDLVESYMRRHMVKPGITGWAQVSGYRGETDTLEKMEKRVEYDLWYIDNWSVSLDAKIIFSTIFKGFIHKNAY